MLNKWYGTIYKFPKRFKVILVLLSLIHKAMKPILLFFVFFIPALLSIKSTDAQVFSRNSMRATIAGVSNGEILKSALLNDSKLFCTNPEFVVQNFNFSVLRENGDLVVYKGIGNALTDTMKNEINSMPAGSKLVIEEIIAVSVDGKSSKLPSVLLIIK